jgi:hypothetical protein
MSNRIIIVIQYLFITIDILCNALGDYFSDRILVQLCVFVIQDLCLILSLIILFLYYFNIEALKSGLLHLIFGRFWSSLALAIVYITLTISLQILNIKLHWNEYMNGIKVDGFKWKSQTEIIVLFLTQRIISAFYYFSYRWTIIKLQDNNLIEKLSDK